MMVDVAFNVRVDIFLHMLGYATLAWTVVSARRLGLTDYRDTVVVVISVSVFGAGIEGLQTIVPTRGFSSADMLANTIGATTILIRAVFDDVRRQYQ
jgi:VanZ family protein